MTPQDSTPQTWRTVADDGPPDPELHPWVVALTGGAPEDVYPQVYRNDGRWGLWLDDDRWAPFVPPVAPAPTPRWTVIDGHPYRDGWLRRGGNAVTYSEVVDALNAADQAAPPAFDVNGLLDWLTEAEGTLSYGPITDRPVVAIGLTQTLRRRVINGSFGPTPPADEPMPGCPVALSDGDVCGKAVPCTIHSHLSPPPADDGAVTVGDYEYRLDGPWLQRRDIGRWSNVKWPLGNATAGDLANYAAAADALGIGWHTADDPALDDLADDVLVRCNGVDGSCYVLQAVMVRRFRDAELLAHWRVDVAHPAAGEAS